VSRHAAHRAHRSPPLAGLPAPLRQAAGTTAALGVAGLALGAAAWAGPLVTATSSESTTDRSVTFGYSATVPLTAAYDGTTVRSPDPVFRTLAHTVSVHYDYRGAPGRVCVAADLSLPGGWRSTLPLTPPSTFKAGSYAGDVRLDLTAIEARARAAAAVTGLSADEIAVTVVPTIVTADGSTFAPSLVLRLTRISLALAGDAHTLTVADSSPVTTSTTVARRLHLLGRTVAVATARRAAAVLTLGALLAAVLLAVAIRSASRRSESTEIRRRYAQLLLPVEPMPTPPGRPVVDVVAFATLAKLAERYGLLVLHWTRSGVETFVVQDDATTFRYRTGAALEQLRPGGAADAGQTRRRAPGHPAPPAAARP